MTSEQDRLSALLEYVRADGRICPQPDQWNELWEMLPNKERIGFGWHPPLPLILAAWDASAVEKMLRLQEHIEFAAAHGALESVDDYLRALPEDGWHRLEDCQDGRDRHQ